MRDLGVVVKHFCKDECDENKVIITRLFESVWFKVTFIGFIFAVFLISIFCFFKLGLFNQFKDVVDLIFQFGVVTGLYFTAIQIRQQDRNHKMQKDVGLFEKRSELRLFFNSLKFCYSREYKRYLSNPNERVDYSFQELLNFSSKFILDLNSCMNFNPRLNDLDNWQECKGNINEKIDSYLKALDSIIEGLYDLLGYFWETRYVVDLDEKNVEFLIELATYMYAYKDCMANCYDYIYELKESNASNEKIKRDLDFKIFIAEMEKIYDMLNDVRGRGQIFHKGCKTSSIESRGRYGYLLDSIEFELNIAENY